MEGTSRETLLQCVCSGTIAQKGGSQAWEAVGVRWQASRDRARSSETQGAHCCHGGANGHSGCPQKYDKTLDVVNGRFGK